MPVQLPVLSVLRRRRAVLGVGQRPLPFFYKKIDNITMLRYNLIEQKLQKGAIV